MKNSSRLLKLGNYVSSPSFGGDRLFSSCLALYVQLLHFKEEFLNFLRTLWAILLLRYEDYHIITAVSFDYFWTSYYMISPLSNWKPRGNILSQDFGRTMTFKIRISVEQCWILACGGVAKSSLVLTQYVVSVSIACVYAFLFD